MAAKGSQKTGSQQHDASWGGRHIHRRGTKKMMDDFHKELTLVVGKYDIPLERLINADPTGVFFAKFPN
jgi:hypothetical protein